MEIKELQTKELKSVIITVRTTKVKANWLKEKKISPTKLFNEAIQELMNKE